MTYSQEALQEITFKQAWKYVASNILKTDSMEVEAWVYKAQMKANSKINLLHGEIQSPQFDSWLFFIDDNPLQNWGHTCRYVFVSKDSISVLSKQFPPKDIEMYDKILSFEFSKSDEISQGNEIYSVEKKVHPTEKALPIYNTPKRYAVILNGGVDKENNNIRYWNDCSYIYSVLLNVYHYDKSNVIVLMSDGTDPAADRMLLDGSHDSSPLDLDGDGTNDINYSATKNNVISVFQSLSSKLTNNDDLFIYTIDHGTLNGNNAALMLWNYESLLDYELGSLLSQIHCNSISIVMGQCNSGGFIKELAGSNRIVITACREDESSYSMRSGKYDEFVYYFTKALENNRGTNADTNSDGIITLYEAYLYAVANDTANEHPQYHSLNKLGSYFSLEEYKFKVKGPDLVCTCEDPQFSVLNAPVNAEFRWWELYNSSITSGQGTSSIKYHVSQEVDMMDIVSVDIVYEGVKMKAYKSVYSGVPEFGYVNYDDSNISPFESVSVEVFFEGAERYIWRTDENCSLDLINEEASRVSITPYLSGTFRSYVKAVNGCGESPEEWITMSASRTMSDFSDEIPLAVKIYTLDNREVYTDNNPTSAFNIATISLDSGIYVVWVYLKDGLIKKLVGIDK